MSVHDEITKVQCPCCHGCGWAELRPIGPTRKASGTFRRSNVHQGTPCQLCERSGWCSPVDAARWRKLAGLSKLARL